MVQTTIGRYEGRDQGSNVYLLFCDNTNAINISKNLVMHTKTKNISLKYHFQRELVEDKEVRMEYVTTKEKIADILTKPMPKDAFLYLRGKLGVIPYLKLTKWSLVMHKLEHARDQSSWCSIEKGILHMN